MRRLIAHIALAFSALVLVGTTFNAVGTKVNSNIEFTNGKELAFRISPKTNYGEVESGEELNEDSVKEIAKEMEARLIDSDVSRYKVVTEGNDTVKVLLSQESQNDYEKIKAYLAFNGTFALTTSKDTLALGEEFLTKGKAYLDDINGYPTVVIPFDNDSTAYKAVYEEAKTQHENGEGETTQDAEGNDVTTTYMYFWYDYIEGYDTYSKTVQSNDEYDEAVASKILMKFNIDEPYFPKANEDDPDKLCQTINVDSNGDQTATPLEVRAAYNTARFFVNLLNASELSYHVDFMYERTATLWVDEVVAMGTHLTVAWSNTFKATIIAVAVLALLLALFYRFGALSIGTTSICATYAGIGVLVLLNAEFNVASVIGLVLVALTSLASGVIYLNKFKEECYRGRSMKKANTEAYKKAILPIVDFHVVLIIIGAFLYILGGSLMRSFAAVTVLGGIASLILSGLALPGLMWLATNANYMNGKYSWFGVSKEQVPDLMNEEKQKYYGAYADKDFTAKKKPVGIVAAVLFVATLAGMIVSGVMTKGEVYAQPHTTMNSQIYLEMKTTASDNDVLESQTRSVLDTVAEGLAISDDVKLQDCITDISLFNRTNVESKANGAETYYYSYYVVSLDRALDGEQTVTFNTVSDTLVNMFSDVHSLDLGFDQQVTISFKEVKVASKDQPGFAKIMLATFVGVAVAAVYLMLRYRLSRGIAALLLTCGVGGITAGLFALIHLAVGAYVIVALPVVALFTLILMIMNMNKEREMVIEDKAHDNSVEHRNEIMVEAGKLACTPIIIFGILAAYLAIDMFAFGATGTAWLFLNVLAGMLVGAIVTVCLLGPVSQFFFAQLKKINIDRPAKAKKKSKKNVQVHKSAEPEEAIFIGIND